MEILKCLHLRSTMLHFVGDLQQAIYDFRHVVPEKVAAFVAANGFSKLVIGCNFRSCQEIVNTCNALVDNASTVKGMGEGRLSTPCLFVTYKDSSIPSLPKWFETFVREKGLDPDKSAIVARGWSTVSRLRPSGNNAVNNYQRRLRMAVHLWKTGGIQGMGDALKYMGYFVAEKCFSKHSWNPREYYCPDCVSSPLRWRLFLARVLRLLTEDVNLSDLNQTWTDWAGSVRKGFGEVARKCQPMLSGFLAEDIESFPDLDPHNFQAPRGDAQKPVSESLGTVSQKKPTTRITTIHSVKGETMEAIMVVSAPSAQGTVDGHWTQWLDSPSTEAARFAYVASSRPRYLLVWAIPEQRGGDYGRLRKYGFVPYNIESNLGS